jgi:hypothetical protein
MIGNKRYKLASLVRASTAAPYYFSPARISVHDGEKDPGLFADGGVSPHNSPALQMLLLAKIKAYKFDWELGDKKLLLISVGTGSYRLPVSGSFLNRAIPAKFAVEALQGLIADTNALNLTLLQMLAKPNKRWTINGEIDDQRDDLLVNMNGVEHPLLSFARYDVKLEEKWLREKLGRRFSKRRLDEIRDFMDPRDLKTNYDIGDAAATFQVTPDDFPDVFDTQP